MGDIPLNREDIIALLTELGQLLYDNNIQSNFLVYGGAVMCVEYELRYSTFDIDCIFTDERVRSYASIMSSKYNIQRDWLNDAILSIVTEDMRKQDFIRTYSLGGLRISVPSIRQMLAMKVFSARIDGSNDLLDAYNLARELGINNSRQIREILTEYFKKESIREQNKKYKNKIGRFIRELEALLNNE